MTIKVGQHGPVYIYIAVNDVETNIRIKLDSVTRVGTDMFSGSGTLYLNPGKVKNCDQSH